MHMRPMVCVNLKCISFTKRILFNFMHLTPTKVNQTKIAKYYAFTFNAIIFCLIFSNKIKRNYRRKNFWVEILWPFFIYSSNEIVEW